MIDDRYLTYWQLGGSNYSNCKNHFAEKVKEYTLNMLPEKGKFSETLVTFFL